MSAATEDGDSVVFAQLTDADRVDDPVGDCRWCQALFGHGDQRNASVRAGHDLTGRLVQLRVVILPVAVLTVVAAVLAEMLG
ncbi:MULTISPECIES: hypothetical protein [Streptomyces]|uniref:hypothetical protein n=1 Tax=Streptomyces TaxID=1883 RepID=UPI0012FF09D4|nr:hypothetical protein [Streptomyces durhamensis]